VRRGASAIISLVVATALLTSVASVATAKAKPTTTTSTTTTTPPVPKLGVPHVVIFEYTSADPVGQGIGTVNCPTGEAALSFAWSAHIGDGSPFLAIVDQPSVRPVLTDGVPTGYEFWGGANPPIARAYVTCASVAA
jgi:hypothetical protein